MSRRRKEPVAVIEPPKVEAAAFTAGDRQSRELASWRPPLQSADMDMLGADDKTTADSRALDLTRNNGIVAGAVQSRKDRVVGSRFRLVLTPDYLTLGMDRTMLRDWAKQIEGYFHAWADDVNCPVDAQRKRTFTELLRDAESSKFLQGEAFISREWRFMPFNSSPYGTCFMLVEPERICNPPGAQLDKVRAGIEHDAWGAPVAYHVRTTHPLDMYNGRGAWDPATWDRVTKFNRFGWLQMIHLYDQQRANQTRGFSPIASVIKRLKMLDRQENVQLELNILAASLAIVIESQFGPNSAMEALGGSQMKQLAEYVSAQSQFKAGSPVLFDGVRIPHLFPGEKLNVSRAEPPGDQFAAFQESMLRHVARGMGATYEAVSGDYSKTNYSSARAAMAESWAAVQSARQFGPAKLATQMFRLWLREAVVRGLVPLPAGVTAEQLIAQEALFAKCSWIGAGRPAIDELKSAKANEVLLATHQTTLAQIAADNGDDWQELLEQASEEAQARESLGLKSEPVQQQPQPFEEE